MTGKLWWWELEAAAHTPSTLKKQGVVPPTLRVGLICSVKTFIAAPSQGVFPW